jgi:hypothetical protein
VVAVGVPRSLIVAPLEGPGCGSLGGAPHPLATCGINKPPGNGRGLV